VHVSYDVPDQYHDKLAPFVDNSTAQGDSRLSYAAMVNFLDGSIGNITAASKAKGMWDNTVMLFFSDEVQRLAVHPQDSRSDVGHLLQAIS
jgi:arylsulfatase A-like enzyme